MQHKPALIVIPRCRFVRLSALDLDGLINPLPPHRNEFISLTQLISDAPHFHPLGKGGELQSHIGECPTAEASDPLGSGCHSKMDNSSRVQLYWHPPLLTLLEYAACAGEVRR